MGGMGHTGVGWGGLCRVGVGWLMQELGGSCRGGVGHTCVGANYPYIEVSGVNREAYDCVNNDCEN